MEVTNFFSNYCRLCAKPHDTTIDLMQNSKSFHVKILDLAELKVHEHDNLPKRLCNKCDEKISSFESFLENCKKSQYELWLIRNSFDPDITVKVESGDVVEFGHDEENSSHVKEEITSEYLQNVIADSEGYTEYDAVDFDVDGTYIDDVTLSALKRIKKKSSGKRALKDKSKRDTEKLKILLKSPDTKVSDYFNFECNVCGIQLESWGKLEDHVKKVHPNEIMKPTVYCVCGYQATSQSSLYKHGTEHKKKSAGCDKQVINPDLIELKCTHCSKSTKSWKSLTNHTRRLHNTLPSIACSCGFVVKSRSMLYKHMAEHKKGSLFICRICQSVKKSAAALATHAKKHEPELLRCAECHKEFTNKDLLRSHLKSHIPISERKVHDCPVCSIRFTTRSGMLSHKRSVHDQVRGYVCDQCGFSCSTNGELKQHRAIHSDEKPFVCDKCNKGFKTRSNLTTHMDTHEDTKYQCYVCARILNSRRTLRKHLLVHDSEYRHKCTYCNKLFKRRHTLKVHMSQHTGDKLFSCKWCDERFMYASTLRSHRLRYHPDKNSAPAQQTYAIVYGQIEQPAPQRAQEVNNDVKQLGLSNVHVVMSEIEVEDCII